jgi:hypothetical protein
MAPRLKCRDLIRATNNKINGADLKNDWAYLRLLSTIHRQINDTRVIFHPAPTSHGGPPNLRRRRPPENPPPTTSARKLSTVRPTPMGPKLNRSQGYLPTVGLRHTLTTEGNGTAQLREIPDVLVQDFPHGEVLNLHSASADSRKTSPTIPCRGWR